MHYEVRIVEQPARPLAVIRRRAPHRMLTTVVPKACGEVWDLIRAKKIPGAGRNIAIYFDGEINLEVGVELESPLTNEDGLIASVFPIGRVATTTHCGTYVQLARPHEAIRAWCETHGHKLAGPNWEIYGHWKDEWNSDPSKIQTDVFYLLD